LWSFMYFFSVLSCEMPEQDGRMDWRGALQLSLLLMAVPAQYYIMQYFPASQEQSQGALIK